MLFIDNESELGSDFKDYHKDQEIYLKKKNDFVRTCFCPDIVYGHVVFVFLRLLKSKLNLKR